MQQQHQEEDLPEEVEVAYQNQRRLLLGSVFSHSYATPLTIHVTRHMLLLIRHMSHVTHPDGRSRVDRKSIVRHC